MKNIEIYKAPKYETKQYTKVKENIYKTYNSFMNSDCYVTSLVFEQEPELDEGESSDDISQYPLEDILDKFYVAVEDFYEAENDGQDNRCILEFSGSAIDDIERLLQIVGKHVYNKENQDGRVELIIE